MDLLHTSSVSSPASDDGTAIRTRSPSSDVPAAEAAGTHVTTAPEIVGRNSILMVGGMLAARLSAFLATIVAVRLLVPEAFAVVVLAQAAVAYLSMILDFGLTLVGMREVAKEPASLHRIMGAILAIRSAVAVVGLALTAAIGIFLGLSGNALAVLVIFAVATAIAALDLSWILQGLQRMGLRAFVVAGTAVLNLSLLIVFLALWRDPMAVALAYLVATLLVVAASAVLVVRTYGPPALPRLPVVQGLVLAAIPLGLGSLLAQIYYNFDILMLGAVRPLTEVAAYGAVYKIVLGLLMLAGTYGVVCMPAYAAAHAKSDATFRRILQRNVRLLSSFILPIVILGTLAAESLAVGFFGEPYRPGGAPLAILMWSVALSFVSSALIYALAAAGHGWYLTGAAAAGAIVNVAFNLALVPRFGMHGAAWATVAAELAVLLVVWNASRRFAVAGLSRHLLLLIPPSVAMIAVGLLLAPMSRGIGAGVGFVVFVLLAGLIGVWTADDRRMLSSVASQLFSRRAAA
jgi:O-antigen/teichoic acid export membrane protein